MQQKNSKSDYVHNITQCVPRKQLQKLIEHSYYHTGGGLLLVLGPGQVLVDMVFTQGQHIRSTTALSLVGGTSQLTHSAICLNRSVHLCSQY